jgi:hypothetical protein
MLGFLSPCRRRCVGAFFLAPSAPRCALMCGVGGWAGGCGGDATGQEVTAMQAEWTAKRQRVRPKGGAPASSSTDDTDCDSDAVSGTDGDTDADSGADSVRPFARRGLGGQLCHTASLVHAALPLLAALGGIHHLAYPCTPLCFFSASMRRASVHMARDRARLWSVCTP